MNAKREALIGCSILSGLGLIALGYFLAALLAGGGMLRAGLTAGQDTRLMVWTVVGLILMVLGVAVVAVGIGAGIVMGRRSTNHAIVNHPDVLVVARFAINETGEMVFQDFDPDDPDTKLYVHLKFPGGRNGEYRCRLEVFDSCGEGMRGTAIIKGDWLGGFAAFPVQPRNPLF